MGQSFEDRYYLANPTAWQRCKRNIDLFISSLMFLVLWMTKDRQVRRALKKAQEENSKIMLDEIFGEEAE
jgi:hypothetical protein